MGKTTRPKPEDALDGGSASALSSIPPLDSIAGYALRRAQLAVFQDFHDTFAGLDLRPAEFSVLAMIAREPGLKQADIAAALAIKPANLVGLINRLEKRGLLLRRRGTRDRRSHALFLAEHAEAELARIAELWRSHEDNVARKLGGEKRLRELVGLLALLRAPG